MSARFISRFWSIILVVQVAVAFAWYCISELEDYITALVDPNANGGHR